MEADRAEMDKVGRAEVRDENSGGKENHVLKNVPEDIPEGVPEDVPEEKKIRVIIYGRVSTKTQEKEETINTQIDRLTPAIYQAGNRKIVKIVKDEDVSGDTPPEDRKHFPIIFQLAERKEFDELWILSRDRLSRDVDLNGYIRTLLSRQGVKVIALDDSKEKTFDRFKDLMGEMELDKYREKRNDGIQRAMKEHRTLQRPPFGYRSVNKKIVIDETKRGLIKELFRDFQIPGMSVKKLSMKYGLSPSLIQRIRSNPIYTTGEIRWGGEVIYRVEPIVKEENLKNLKGT
jgi:DNA invertase Pin-like site-specific DNA recombinase